MEESEVHNSEHLLCCYADHERRTFVEDALTMIRPPTGRCETYLRSNPRAKHITKSTSMIHARRPGSGLEMSFADPATGKRASALTSPYPPDATGRCIRGVLLAGDVAVVGLKIACQQQSCHPHDTTSNGGCRTPSFRNCTNHCLCIYKQQSSPSMPGRFAEQPPQR